MYYILYTYYIYILSFILFIICILYYIYIIYIYIYIYIYIIFIYYESYSVGLPQFVKTDVPGTTLKRFFILGILGRKYNFPRLVFFLKL